MFVFTIYVISGILHAFVSWNYGDKCGWSSDMWWFCCNFVVTAIETAVTQFLRACMNTAGRKAEFEVWERSAWGRILGYLWVYLFLFWSVPKWHYSKLHCQILERLGQF